ncbi:MAG: NADH-quinone oxidoreductase subunit J [Pseudomonadota bacterium]
MTIDVVLFTLFSAMLLSSALMVILSQQPVRAVLSLVCTFVAAAGLWLLLEAEFLAIALIIVYVGAVMVLFLFVVMMLDMEKPGTGKTIVRYFPLGVLLLLGLFWSLVQVIGPQHFGLSAFPIPPEHAENYSHVSALGLALFQDYLLPFECAGMLLLAAMVCAIVLTHRGPMQRKVQNVEAQIRVRAEDRLRMVDLPSAPRLNKGQDE